ncbi:MAG: TetR/AcrR family transcriptional regulator [Rhizobiaceae bacterium]|nr:TetR/AcrR family transcriptional regulator [Rhizobiaceae bacterium]
MDNTGTPLDEEEKGEPTDIPGNKSAKTRERILDAAAFVFSRKGFSRTRLSDIAKVAEIKTGSIYYHFSSREELTAEVMARGVSYTYRTVMARLDELPEGTDNLTRLKTAIDVHLRCLIERSEYARANTKLNGQVPKHIQALHSSNEAKYGEVWRKLLRDAAANGQLRQDLNLSAIRMFILGAMSWSVEWYKPENGPAASVAHDFTEMILNGLIAPPPAT